MKHTPTSTQKVAAAAYIKHHKIQVRNGKAVLYKVVRADGLSSESASCKRGDYGSTGRKRMTTPYTVGATLTAPDFKASAVCGAGLHLSPTTRQASSYFWGTGRAKYFECEVDANSIIPLSSYKADKCKVQTLTVVAEVTRSGARLVNLPKATAGPKTGSKWGKASWSVAKNRKTYEKWNIGPEKDGITALHRFVSTKTEVKLIKTKNLAKSYALS